jgi:hypothetical protein
MNIVNSAGDCQTMPFSMREEREDGEVGYSYKSMKNFFGDIRAVYNFYRDETAQKGKPRIGEWFVKWERVAPPKPIEEEQPHFSAAVTATIVNKAKTQMYRTLYRRLTALQEEPGKCALSTWRTLKSNRMGRVSSAWDARFLQVGKTQRSPTKPGMCQLIVPSWQKSRST